MKKFIHILFILLTFALTGNSFAVTAASESVAIVDPYVRAVPPGQAVSAAFMQLNNSSDNLHTIIGASSPVSRVAELHTHTKENGMMKMRRVELIEVPANGKTLLQPGGLHIMLIDLHDQLKLEQKVSITLEFLDGSSKTIEAPVRKIMMKGMKH